MPKLFLKSFLKRGVPLQKRLAGQKQRHIALFHVSFLTYLKEHFAIQTQRVLTSNTSLPG